MLLELYIENFAIIDKLQIHFQKNLNVLTGETGSGKSIIIEALDLLCGQRFHKSFIRDVEKATIVEGTFLLSPKESTRFREYGYDPEDGQVIISRMLDRNKTVNRINGRMASLSTISELMYRLMDIHGQNSSTSLLRKDSYLTLIDRFNPKETERLKQEIKKNYVCYKNLCRQFQDLNLDESEKDREIGILTFQIEEIGEVDLENMQEDQIMQRYEELSNVQHLKDKMQEIASVFRSEINGISLHGGMEIVRKNLEQVRDYSESLKQFDERYQSLYFEMEDLFLEMASYGEALYEDEETLFQLNQTIEKLTQLKRKYGKKISDILDFKEQAKRKREALYELEKHQTFLRKEMKSVLEQAMLLADELSEIRKDIAKTLEMSIERNLKDLNMMHTKFRVDLQRLQTVRENGIDDCDFLIATNPGQPLKPLADIASGGEISRIMLGFKSTFAEIDKIDTLIFDEIDTGISGRTAQVVGEKMLDIAYDRQVICISHLPQIAALSDHHLLITKEQKESETLSNVISISKDRKVDELSRMIGGVDITDTTKKQALEMLTQAENLKKERYYGKE